MALSGQYVLKEGFGKGAGALPTGAEVTVEDDDTKQGLITVTLPGLGGSPLSRRVSFKRDDFRQRFKKKTGN